MITDLINWIVGLFLNLISIVLNAIFSIFGDINIPAFNTFSSYLHSLWDLIFSSIGYVRSIFLIDQFEWNLILTILTLKLLYKPTIALVKMFIGWYNKLKL